LSKNHSFRCSQRVGPSPESYTEMMKGVGASSRVLDLIEKPPAVPPRPAMVSNERFRGRIEFDKVTFAYAGLKK
jgi:ABC-type multidrug transport system fused ATPase/permease subunit